MSTSLWTLHDGRFQTSGPGSWLAGWRTLRTSLGTEAHRLTKAAGAGNPDLRMQDRLWAQRLTNRLRIRIHRHGLGNIEGGEQYVVVALHEGFADVLALLSVDIDMRFAGRSELWQWPVLGDYLRAADHLIVDPERPVASLRTLLRNAEEIFAQGESLALFAQGTLLGIETGVRPGAFEVARRTNRRVLPVAIAGTHRIWEYPFSPRLRFGCPVWVEVLPPVTVTDSVIAAEQVQRRLKERALAQRIAPVRRFEPDRDGIWPDYEYTIDAAFPEVAQRLDELGSAVAVEQAG